MRIVYFTDIYLSWLTKVNMGSYHLYCISTLPRLIVEAQFLSCQRRLAPKKILKIRPELAVNKLSFGWMPACAGMTEIKDFSN
jgi:hypothetical protein